MNKKCAIALKLTGIVPYHEDTDYIGADKGALILAEQGIHMVLAAGDFDSVKEGDMDQISLFADRIETLNCIKDDSDSEHVIREAIEMGYEEILVYGAFGGRKDHEYVNIRLCEKFPNKVVLVDERNRMETVGPGCYEFDRSEYKYVSIFTRHGAVVSYTGMKYSLDHVALTEEDLYGLSNEVEHEKGSLTVHEGSVLLIRSKD